MKTMLTMLMVETMLTCMQPSLFYNRLNEPAGTYLSSLTRRPKGFCGPSANGPRARSYAGRGPEDYTGRGPDYAGLGPDEYAGRGPEDWKILR